MAIRPTDAEKTSYAVSDTAAMTTGDSVEDIGSGYAALPVRNATNKYHLPAEWWPTP